MSSPEEQPPDDPREDDAETGPGDQPANNGTSIDEEETIPAGNQDDPAGLSVLAGRLLDGGLAERAVNLPEAGKFKGPGALQPGDMIGRYKLLRKIGEGGMGEVWKAEQREPYKKEVALKIIKAGMDTKEVVARFEVERQALAMMSHRNIAKVIDGGTTDWGGPYFVMDYVAGKPVDKFCDEKKLGMRERLEIFRRTCDALAHAHQKGIIHRDIKPSNILVCEENGQAVPKVIDFGIAKATTMRLTEMTYATMTQQAMGTPPYMSPEQAGEGTEFIDVRSDIYSLGVLLYELLTGRPPFEAKELLSKGLFEMRRMICEDRPPKPSTCISGLDLEKRETAAASRRLDSRQLEPVVRGELDWIVMKALEKERERRYQTANAFAQDIENYLENKPVSASPPSIIYTVSKYMRRHRVAAASIAAITVTIVAASIISTWQAMVAIEARKVAEEEQRKAERSLFIAGDAHQGATDLAAEVLLVGVNETQRDGESGTPEAEEFRSRLMGVVQDQARIINGYFESVPPGADAQSRHMRAIVLNSRGYLARKLGDFEKARIHYTASLEIREGLLGDDPGQALYLHNLAVSYDNLGDLHVQMAEDGIDAADNYAEALGHYHKGLSYAKKLEGLPDAVPYFRHDLAVSYLKIGDALYHSSFHKSSKAPVVVRAEAIEQLEKGLPIAMALAKRQENYVKWQELLGLYSLQLGRCHAQKKPDDEAVPHLERAQEVLKKLPDTAENAERLDEIAGVLASVQR